MINKIVLLINPFLSNFLKFYISIKIEHKTHLRHNKDTTAKIFFVEKEKRETNTRSLVHLRFVLTRETNRRKKRKKPHRKTHESAISKEDVFPSGGRRTERRRREWKKAKKPGLRRRRCYVDVWSTEGTVDAWLGSVCMSRARRRTRAGGSSPGEAPSQPFLLDRLRNATRARDPTRLAVGATAL